MQAEQPASRLASPGAQTQPGQATDEAPTPDPALSANLWLRFRKDIVSGHEKKTYWL